MNTLFFSSVSAEGNDGVRILNNVLHDFRLYWIVCYVRAFYLTISSNSLGPDISCFLVSKLCRPEVR